MCECGLDLDTFWDCSWYELDLYRNRHKKKVRHESNLTRLIMWSNLAPNSKKRITPEQVWRLEGDNLRNAPVNKEHAIAIAKRFLPYLQKKE